MMLILVSDAIHCDIILNPSATHLFDALALSGAAP